MASCNDLFKELRRRMLGLVRENCSKQLPGIIINSDEQVLPRIRGFLMGEERESLCIAMNHLSGI